MIFLLLPTYPISTSTVTSSFTEKKKSAVSKTLFFSFHLRCCKNENLWWFSPYPVNTTIIWPTTDRIPHSLIFKRMQIKRIADNIRAFSFLLTNWNKEPDEERIYRWTEFFHKLDNKKWKMRTGARATKQNYISIYISLYMKTFLKTGHNFFGQFALNWMKNNTIWCINTFIKSSLGLPSERTFSRALLRNIFDIFKYVFLFVLDLSSRVALIN